MVGHVEENIQSMNAIHVMRSCPSIASTQSGYKNGGRKGSTIGECVCSVRQPGRSTGGRRKQTAANTRAVSAVKRCHDSPTAKKASLNQMLPYAKSAIERSSRSGKVGAQEVQLLRSLQKPTVDPQRLYSPNAFGQKGERVGLQRMSVPQM